MCNEEKLAAAASVAIDDDGLQAVFDDVTGAMRLVFGQARTAACAADFVRALVCAPGAGSTWGLAEAVGHRSPGRFQALLRETSWDSAELVEAVTVRAAADLAGCEEGVFIVDETAILKHGSASVGVSTQHAGVTGRLENCQTIVNAVFDNGTVEAWIDFRLYLPECWTGDTVRRQMARVPERVEFQTKPELAAAMLSAALEQALPVRWLAGDEVYGAAGELRGAAESAGFGFVMAVRSNHWIDLDSGEHMRAEEALAQVEESLSWETRSCGTGSKGMRLYQWAHLGLADGTTLLMRRRTAEKNCEKIDFYLRKAPAGAVCPPSVFLRICGRRWPIWRRRYLARARWHHHQTRLGLVLTALPNAKPGQHYSGGFNRWPAALSPI